MISESPSGVCSTKPGQAGKGMGEKCHGKRRDWDTGTPRPVRVRSQGFAAGKSGQGKGKSKQIQKNIGIKTICVEEENMDSKGRITVLFPKARIIIKKSQLR